MKFAAYTILTIFVLIGINSCQEGDFEIDEPCSLSGTVEMIHGTDDFIVRIDQRNEVIRVLRRVNDYCPILMDMEVQDGMRIKLSYRILNKVFPANEQMGIPQTQAVELLCIGDTESDGFLYSHY